LKIWIVRFGTRKKIRNGFLFFRRTNWLASTQFYSQFLSKEIERTFGNIFLYINILFHVLEGHRNTKMFIFYKKSVLVGTFNKMLVNEIRLGQLANLVQKDCWLVVLPSEQRWQLAYRVCQFSGRKMNCAKT